MDAVDSISMLGVVTVVGPTTIAAGLEVWVLRML